MNTKIQITNDGGHVYQDGTIISVEQLFRDYRDTLTEANMSTYHWLCRIPIPSAVDFIAKAWGFDYKII
jgi:hypothetical protein